MRKTTKTISLQRLGILSVLAFGLIGMTADEVYAKSYSCPASKSWVTDPNPPEEVPKGKDADFCQFYQFSWQWFLDLVSPSSSNPSLRNFQVEKNFPTLEGKVDNKQQDSCDGDAPEHFMFVRLEKTPETDSPFIIPERIGQAGDGATIYDQDKNVVFYDVRFSRNLCNVGPIQNSPNFPSGTTTLKSAWRIIAEQDKPDYFWMEADVDGVPGNELLGMIGFHLVRATELHPELIWATFEHKSNDPDCSNPQPLPAGGWSFTSAECAKTLASGGDKTSCDFNKAEPATSLKGTPTEICRMYPDGSLPTDPKADKNITAINDLNAQLVGPDGFLTALPAGNPMAVWKNYFIVGALWESDITKPSSDISNQRGSLRLANTVMETTFQDGFKPGQPYSSNCFGCHGYKPNQSNTVPAAKLNHIFDDIIAGQCSAQDVNAGPIWSNADAQQKCPKVCLNNGGWNGQWTTTVPGSMSVCGCCDVQ